MSDGYIGLFRVPEVGVQIPRLTTPGSVTFNVAEKVETGGERGTEAIAEISISNVDIESGAIKTIQLQEKLSADGTYRDAISAAVDWSGNDNSGTFQIRSMSTRPAGLNHDFRCYLLNSDGEKAIGTDSGTPTSAGSGSLTDTGASWVTNEWASGNVETDVGTFPISSNTGTVLTITGDATGATTYRILGASVVLTDVNVSFNGVDDFADLPEVLNLAATNSSGSGEGSVSSPENLPNSGVIRLEWDDMKVQDDISSHPHADGTPRTVTAPEWSSISEYIVYMFIATGQQAPQNEYPSSTDTNGTWYFVAKTTDLFYEIDCPKNKFIGFWVGCKTNLTALVTGVVNLPYSAY